MLLGILLHISWFLVPFYYNTPFMDVSGNAINFAFFNWIHTFRMQAFMFVAGFFGALVLARYGLLGFLRHRLTRVGIPFVVASVILLPWISVLYTAGGMKSGRILTDSAFWPQAWERLASVPLMDQPLWHLWFLYDLLLLYGVTLAIVFLVRAIDRGGKLRGRLGSWFRPLMRSWVAIPVLAIPVGIAVWDHHSWLGIVSGYNLTVDWAGLLTGYLPFFLVGWIVYRYQDLLAVADRRWRVYLVAGTAVALLTSAGYERLFAAGRVNFWEPAMAAQQILDYGDLRAGLLVARDSDEDTVAKRTWDSLSPLHQRAIEQLESASVDQKSGLAAELTGSVLARDDFATPELCATVELSAERATTCALAPEARDADETFLLNRRLVEATFPQALSATIDVDRPFMRWKPLYAYAYGLTGWLLTLGFLGCFRRFFSRPSPRFRYLADSSYWLYIMHLPVLYHIQILIAPWELPWPVKYVIYLVPTMIVLLLSYHYLVRSTVIGQVLNGRRYPFRPLLVRGAGELSVRPAASRIRD